ncbi:MAG: alcohol dehydrogenase catalytic domain-containing protein, partial [Candidatus Binatia bacterium]
MASVRGATLLGPDKLELREYPMPDIPADGGLLKIEMGGVCGTDVKYLHGKLKVDYPIILGHEILGRVEKLGKNAAAIHHVKEGDRVILKGALGCGRCADCRRNNQRFCRQRTNYGGRTKCDLPPHLFGGFADYLYRSEVFKLPYNRTLKLYAQAGELEREFSVRCQEAAREARDKAV